MITRITLGPAPPPGKYSSGKRGVLSANAEHPAEPSRDTPAAPAPAALKKSLRVSALSVFLPTPEKSSQHSQKANCIRARSGPLGLRLSAHYASVCQHAQANAFACQHASSLRLSLSANPVAASPSRTRRTGAEGRWVTELAGSA